MSYFLSYCSDVQNYLKACEQLLSAAKNDQHFTEEELQMVESYAIDVAKMHKALVNGKDHLVT